MDKVWEEIHSNQTWGQYPSEPVIRFVARNFYACDRDKTRILDFGCGQGATTWYLAREGFKTYAFDGSVSAIKKCREKLEKEGLDAELKVSDGMSIDYPADCFDAVIDNACIYANEVTYIIEMYKKIYEILKPGGLFFSSCFGWELTGINTGIEVEPGTFLDIKDGVLANRGLSHIFKEEELRGLLQEVGFVIRQCDWIKYRDGENIIHQIVCIAEKG